MAAYYRNPANGYVVKATGEFTWLWAFLFGPFYFGYKGLWGHAVLYALAAVVTLCISWFIYPFFAKGLVNKRYLELGWEKLDAPPRHSQEPHQVAATIAAAPREQAGSGFGWPALAMAAVVAFAIGGVLPLVPKHGNNVVSALPPPESARKLETGAVPAPWVSEVKQAPKPTVYIPVASDLRAQYELLEMSKRTNGRVSILTKRKGPSGVSYSLRECDCKRNMFRYLGDGDSLAIARTPKVPAEDFVALVGTGGLGSVSYHVCQYACSAGRG